MKLKIIGSSEGPGDLEKKVNKYLSKFKDEDIVKIDPFFMTGYGDQEAGIYSIVTKNSRKK